jgi:hypothetical protein
MTVSRYRFKCACSSQKCSQVPSRLFHQRNQCLRFPLPVLFPNRTLVSCFSSGELSSRLLQALSFAICVLDARFTLFTLRICFKLVCLYTFAIHFSCLPAFVSLRKDEIHNPCRCRLLVSVPRSVCTGFDFQDFFIVYSESFACLISLFSLLSLSLPLSLVFLSSLLIHTKKTSSCQISSASFA